MFDFVRRHNKLLMILMFLFGIPGLLMFRVEDYFRGDQKGERVAHVDGHDITKQDWDAQHRMDVDNARRQAPNMDPALFDTDAARYTTLERMLRTQVLTVAAQKSRFIITEERQKELFASDPGLSQFVIEKDGKRQFDAESFRRATGLSPQQYQEQLASELRLKQVLAGIGDSAFATRAQADSALNAFFDRREIQVARFDTAQYLSRVTVDDAQLQAYYKEHSAKFQAPEQARIEYIVLDLEAAKKGVAVNEADLRTYYEQNGPRFGKKEERQASHILISAPRSASAAEREQAKAKAESLLAELRKTPGSFAELARKNSQDPGSAEKGGALDFVARGAMVKPFDDAMFALKKGEISNVVETDFGYHIIRLDDLHPAMLPPFEAVRSAIADELRAQQATQEFAKAAEIFTDGVYQQADSLKPTADKLGLTIHTADGVGRTPVPGAAGPLASRNFLSALYATDSLERKNNTEAIEIGSNQLAAGRIVQYSPARTEPFEEIKDKVRALAMGERAAALARQEGEARRTAWQANAQGASVGQPMLVSRVAPQAQPRQVIEAALRADAAKLPAWVGVDLGLQGYAVVRVNKAMSREAPPAEVAKGELEQFAQAVGEVEQTAYYRLLQERFKAQILVPRPADMPAR